jgi:hypothetical protein
VTGQDQRDPCDPSRTTAARQAIAILTSHRNSGICEKAPAAGPVRGQAGIEGQAFESKAHAAAAVGRKFGPGAILDKGAQPLDQPFGKGLLLPGPLIDAQPSGPRRIRRSEREQPAFGPARGLWLRASWPQATRQARQSQYHAEVFHPGLIRA